MLRRSVRASFSLLLTRNVNPKMLSRALHSTAVTAKVKQDFVCNSIHLFAKSAPMHAWSEVVLLFSTVLLHNCTCSVL